MVRDVQPGTIYVPGDIHVTACHLDGIATFYRFGYDRKQAPGHCRKRSGLLEFNGFPLSFFLLGAI
jgi:hypothetical protein